ncbi:MAG TPA: hypothetical protein VI583_15780 [Cyclobacteriaceae bacterium]|nr:hypothetical protein [Cyclobacteriaceae bacterium]
MNRFFPLLTLMAVMITAYGQVSDTVSLSYGKIYVSGKTSDKQIFFKKGNEIRKISSFKPWEEIYTILLSRDKHKLLIYHKTSQEAGRNLSIMDLSDFSIVRTVKPGYGGSLFWTNDNNILMIWGCGSACACFRLYNMQFHVLQESCESCLQEFIDEDILVSIPCMVASRGVFKIFSLKDGSLLKEISYFDQYGNYYALEISLENQELRVRLMGGQNMDSVIIERIRCE